MKKIYITFMCFLLISCENLGNVQSKDSEDTLNEFEVLNSQLMNRDINLSPQSKELVGEAYDISNVTPNVYSHVDDTFLFYLTSDVVFDTIVGYYSESYEFDNIIYVLNDQSIIIYVPYDMALDGTKETIKILDDLISK